MAPLCFLSILSFSLLTLSSSSTVAITIPLSPPSTAAITIPLSSPSTTSHTDPWQRLNHLASSSVARAHHLKSHRNSSVLTKAPLFPHSYGGYSVSLSFGTPPQTLSLIMDTGSSLVWLPCTTRYVCSSCNFPNISSANISTFIPKSSSSVKLLGCKNPKCGWVFEADVGSRCRDCDPGSRNCTRTCPAYLIQYGSGTTAGLLMSETLDFPDKAVGDFVVGCSVFSTQQPSGIAGFGRGRSSLPSQMGLKKFSYCLVSHRFDDKPEGSDLVLVGGSDSGHAITGGLSYTPFLNNTKALNPAFRDYYYVNLRKITVGRKRVKIPYRYLVPGSDGHGGTMVDSGTTFTFMDKVVFDLVAQEFEMQMSGYNRANGVENQSGLRPCFDISGEKSVLLPELVFHFKGGGEMALPLADYFSFVGNSGVICMTIVTGSAVSPAGSVGPSIILGNYQQQNFYLEFDLENERLGFRKQVCK